MNTNAQLVQPHGFEHVSAGLSDKVLADLERYALEFEPELIRFRRDLHRHPELSLAEIRTTQQVADRLAAAGLKPRLTPGTGLVCDLPSRNGDRPALALRADLDALPVLDEKDVEYRSINSGVSHACGHDVHTATVLGAGLVLAEMSKHHELPVPVRLIFQPAEEVLRGATSMIEAGALDGVGQIMSLHCDPKIDAGRIGLRTGPLTSACDLVKLTVTGPGGHTSRPHLTTDVVFALASMVTALPGAITRKLDPRSPVSIVWGHIDAGHTHNAIPVSGIAEGTIRCMDEKSWVLVPELVREAIVGMAASYGVTAELEYTRGVPPVVNEAKSIELFTRAAETALGAKAITETEQSLGGEDFSWYLRQVPGAMARLGVRQVNATTPLDLHQGSFDVDESAIGVGVRMLAAAALLVA
ncbi:amidohydrolase [Streptacidiphilus sp. PAMC 29251]